MPALVVFQVYIHFHTLVFTCCHYNTETDGASGSPKCQCLNLWHSERILSLSVMRQCERPTPAACCLLLLQLLTSQGQ